MPFTKKKIYKTDYRSLTWYLACRAAVITFLLGGAAIFYWGGPVATSAAGPLLLLIAISYAQAICSALLLRLVKRINLFTQTQIVWDLLFVTAIILLTGGVESVFSFVYLLVIVSASFMLPRRQTFFAAASAAILFGGILDLQYFHYLNEIGLYRNVSGGAFLSAVFVHVVAFFLSAGLSGTLAERWRASEAELERKTVDFAELEEMNRTILSHISSGLMLVSADGRVLSFNRAASEITGLQRGEVYQQPVNSLFPNLGLLTTEGFSLVSRAEAVFEKSSKEKLVLGYATTVAKGHRRDELGLLVTFQDLTQLKMVEEQLQRADRLAAVGRLASGMAHEIRNPLASISGSVQLLLEASHGSDEDRRLMSIVVCEADRLSGLLTDFLTYARPPVPNKERINVIAVVNELCEMLAADQRFSQITIRKQYSEQVEMELDRGQIWQVLWDLAINAAEAMPEGGELHIRVDFENSSITVEDTGPGIAEEIRSQIFDPFFSTKEKGTGLGLASVYSVVEAHGGKIDVSPGVLGGAKFTLIFSDTES